MRVVLIQPKAYRHAPDWVYEPMNLGYLGSYLISHGHKNVKVKIGAWDTEKNIIKEASKADVVGITATSPMFIHGLHLAQQIKRTGRDPLIVFGGTHATCLPESTLKNPAIDLVVRGEGEATFLEIVKTVQESGDFSSVLGISLRRDGGIQHNPHRPLIEDLDSIPPPSRKLTRLNKFSEIYRMSLGKRTANMLSSRGCPFQCTYCASHSVWTRKCRMRSPENILDEIADLIKYYKIGRINFHDDTFTIDKNRVIEFCDRVIKSGLKFQWGCNVHVNTVDRELLQKMQEAGCDEIWIGVESGSPEILKAIKKNSNISKIKEVFADARELSIRRHAYLMVGVSEENRETIQATRQLVEDIQPDIAAVTIFTPYPGCEAYEEAKKSGYVKDDMDWSNVDLHHTVSMPTSYLTKDELTEEFQKLSKEYSHFKRQAPKRSLSDKIRFKLKTASLRDYPGLIVKLIIKIICLPGILSKRK
ncbi:B12-binding domain-containing radical SAM protein [Acidobacteriota bacterium]